MKPTVSLASWQKRNAFLVPASCIVEPSRLGTTGGKGWESSSCREAVSMASRSAPRHGSAGRTKSEVAVSTAGRSPLRGSGRRSPTANARRCGTNFYVGECSGSVRRGQPRCSRVSPSPQESSIPGLQTRRRKVGQDVVVRREGEETFGQRRGGPRECHAGEVHTRTGVAGLDRLKRLREEAAAQSAAAPQNPMGS